MSQVTPGDLCRTTMYDDPVETAEAMRYWFGHDEAGALVAVVWLEALTDALAETLRHD